MLLELVGIAVCGSLCGRVPPVEVSGCSPIKPVVAVVDEDTPGSVGSDWSCCDYECSACKYAMTPQQNGHSKLCMVLEF